MRRLVVALLLLSGLVLYGQPAGADEADVEEASAVLLDPTDLLPPVDDEGPCTGAPETLPGIFDFTEACAAHDACYAQGEDRGACDEAFREDLVASCVAQHADASDPRRYFCLGFAAVYYTAVRVATQLSSA